MNESDKLGRKVLLAAAGISLVMMGRELIRRLGETDLQGQVALITGGSRGLGLLLAGELAKEGCRVAICARDAGELERARQDLEQHGAEVLAVICDISDNQQAERLVHQVTKHFGRIDILVNNAGNIQVGPVQNMTLGDFREAEGIMFWGTLSPTLAVLPQMLRRRSGRIVNITSIGGKVSVPHLLPYNCAKFAAVGLSEGLGAELAGSGIKVTTVVPGLMRTGSYLNALFKGNHEGEYTWFSLGSALPLISMDAERAACQIVRAAKRGESEIILSTPANILARFHGLFPGTTVKILGWASQILLPSGQRAETGAEWGMEVRERIRSRLLDTLTRWGLTAAGRFNQYPGPLTVAPRRHRAKRTA